LPWREGPFQRVNSNGIVPEAILLSFEHRFFEYGFFDIVFNVTFDFPLKGMLCCAHMTSDRFAPSTLDKP
jgi:hypothetical protein